MHFRHLHDLAPVRRIKAEETPRVTSSASALSTRSRAGGPDRRGNNGTFANCAIGISDWMLPNKILRHRGSHREPGIGHHERERHPRNH